MGNKIVKLKSILTLLLPSFLFVLCSGISFYLTDQTLNSKLDHFSNQFNDYYHDNYISRETAPIIRIQSKTKNSLQDLYSNFYYTNSSTVNYSFRQFYPGNSQFTSCKGQDYSICLNKQQGFSIGEKYDFGYYLDNGLFSTYFKDEVLPNKGYWQRREGADGVCYISDTLADKLAEEYGIVPEVTDLNREEVYKALIKPEEFYTGDKVFKPTLNLKIDGEDTGVVFCINNILYSEERTGPRVQQLYGDFCVMFGAPLADNQLRYCTEYDMKNDIYGNSSFFKRVNALGYDKENADFSFFKYDYSKTQYEENQNLKVLFEKIDFSQNDSFLYLFAGLVSLLFACFIIIWRRNVGLNMLLFSAIFLFFNLFICFVFVEPLCNLFIVLDFLVAIVAFATKIVKPIVKNRIRFKYEEINI